MDNSPKIKDSTALNAKPAQRKDPSWFGGQLTDLSRVGVPFFWFVVLGCVFIGFFGGVGRAPSVGLPEIARWLVAAGGILATGVTTGFLFAVPRTLRRDTEAIMHRPAVADSSVHKEVDQVRPDEFSPTTTIARYTVNSNLEQISDWLTKIIVGVGLTQLHNLPELASRAATFLAGGENSTPQERAFAVSLILYFGVIGFSAGYLLTRVYVTGAFVRADSDNDRLS